MAAFVIMILLLSVFNVSLACYLLYYYMTKMMQ